MATGTIKANASKTDLNGYVYGGRLANGTDLNDVVTPGHYFLSSNFSFVNVPATLSTLIVQKGASDSTAVLQIGFSTIQVWFRYRTNATDWDVWKTITGSRGWLPSGSDLNDVINPGVWGLTGTYTYSNMPSGVTDGLLEVLGPSMHGTYAVQRLTRFNGTGEYIRYRGNNSGTTWSSWIEIDSIRTPTTPTWDTTKVNTSSAATYLTVKRCGHVIRVGGGFTANAEIGLNAVTIATGFPKSLDRITGSIVAMNTTTNKPLSLAIDANGNLVTYYSGEAVASGQAVRFNVTYFTNDP